MRLSLIYSSPININKSLAMVRPSSVTSLGPCPCNLGFWGKLRRGPHVARLCCGVSDTQKCPGANAASRRVGSDMHLSPLLSSPVLFLWWKQGGQQKGQDIARRPWVEAPWPPEPAGTVGLLFPSICLPVRELTQATPRPGHLTGGRARGALRSPRNRFSARVLWKPWKEADLVWGVQSQVLLSELSVTQR